MIPDLVVAALQFYRDPRSFAQITQSNTELPAGITELLAAPGKELSEENLSETAKALGATEDECREIVPFHDGPAQAGTTMLDVTAGDELWVDGKVGKVATVYVHRSHPPSDDSEPVRNGHAFLASAAATLQ